ncbi:hypothetical protein DFH05DRAFT_1461665 [Lentinula detonsa]|uniref:Uncharacterized protein n=1 Tax=Lentinula detonsa TaxID=2804962 RepID=A0A9W8TW70_9AGAR|nr:hypothetical protein DFH05DRAFT_1461665 [Lentinula detonsa]
MPATSGYSEDSEDDRDEVMSHQYAPAEDGGVEKSQLVQRHTTLPNQEQARESLKWLGYCIRGAKWGTMTYMAMMLGHEELWKRLLKSTTLKCLLTTSRIATQFQDYIDTVYPLRLANYIVECASSTFGFSKTLYRYSGLTFQGTFRRKKTFDHYERVATDFISLYWILSATTLLAAINRGWQELYHLSAESEGNENKDNNKSRDNKSKGKKSGDGDSSSFSFES